jgi:hypothetical protein
LNERVGRARISLNSNANFCYPRGKEVGGENRLDYRKMGDNADVAASAKVVFVEMSGRRRYR